MSHYTDDVEVTTPMIKVAMGKMAIEVMFFDPNAKVSKVIAHYN
ncbi:MAG: hypothetical protein NTU95_02940 [Methanothrix sp.]|nr:hypothetical protein [Methanothrix sp.]